MSCKFGFVLSIEFTKIVFRYISLKNMILALLVNVRKCTRFTTNIKFGLE
jgi:hypothetical protein